MNFKRTFVTDPAELEEIVLACKTAGVVGFDTETCYHPDWKHGERAALDPYKNRIRLVQLAVEGRSWCVDMFAVKRYDWIRDLCMDKSVRKVGQNLKFETINAMHHWDGCWIENAFDTYLVSKMTQTHVKRENQAYPPGYDPSERRHDLASVVARVLKVTLPKDEQTSDWAADPLTQSQLDYAFMDAEIVLELHEPMRQRIINRGMQQVALIEFNAIAGIAEMEYVGWRVDPQILDEIEVETKARARKMRAMLELKFPSDQYGLFEPAAINVDSPAQLAKGLHERYHITPKSTSAGELLKWLNPDDQMYAKQILHNRENIPLEMLEESDVDTKDVFHRYPDDIMEMASQACELQETINLLVDYSSLDTMTKIPQEIRQEIHPVTGRVHADIFQIGQDQHRTAVRKPNWAKIPRPDTLGPYATNEWFKLPNSLRHAFIPADGCKFVICDYAQNQLRIVADRSNESKMVAEFNKGKKADVYRQTAAGYLNKPPEKITKIERTFAKVRVLSYSFGVGAKRNQQQQLEDTRVVVPLEQCKKERNEFLYKIWPELPDWHKAEIGHVRQNCFTATRAGRKIFFHPQQAPNIYTEAINFPVCATEVDGTRLALGKLKRAIAAEGLDARIVGFVYDEFVTEAAIKDADRVAELQQEIMTECMQKMLHRVPALVEFNGLADTWAEK